MTHAPAGLHAESIRKTFGGVAALDDVSLHISPGTIHGLCGENGAGKSTLIGILGGTCTPDAGSVAIDGVSLPPANVRAAEARGIVVIHQEPLAFSDLSAEDSIFVGHEPVRLGGFWLDRRSIRTAAAGLLGQLGQRFDVTRRVADLSLAQRQMTAIARALSRKCRYLILDEPTAALSAREVRVLLDTVRRLALNGVGVLYVSHRLEEILEIATVVSVLRNGHMVGAQSTAGLTQPALIRLMVGREIREWATADTSRGQNPLASTPAIANQGRAALEVHELSRPGAFYDVSLQVHAGEIVGLAGLVGAGRSELARAIAGVERWARGSVLVCGQSLRSGGVRAAMDAGAVLVPEDRRHEGLVLPLPIAENLTLAIVRDLARGCFLSKARERPVVDYWIKELSVRTPSVERLAQTLSGGNQQKVLLGKWLAAKPRVLLLDEPTRGVDVGAKAEIYTHIRRLAAQGLAVLLISSDLPEILALSDRVLVMRAGRLAGELAGSELSQEAVLSMAVPDSAEDEPLSRQTARQDSAAGAADHADGDGAAVAAACGKRELPPGAVQMTRRRELGIALMLAMMLAGAGSANPALLAASNLSDMLVQCVPAIIVGCGLTLVIVTGEIDISVGSLLGVLAALMGVLSSPQKFGLPVASVVVLTLSAGLAIGLMNGLLVTLGRVPSIIATLGMLSALRGVTELLMGGEWITDLPSGLRLAGTGRLAGIPLSVIAAIMIVTLSLWIAHRTPLGRRLYAIGSNPDAARIAGLPIHGGKLFAFSLTGFFTAVAALVSVPQLSVIESGIGVGFELMVVTAVVVGGSSIRGGSGTVSGTLLAVLLLGTVRTALLFLKLGDVGVYWERAIQGALIIAAMLLDPATRAWACGKRTA